MGQVEQVVGQEFARQEKGINQNTKRSLRKVQKELQKSLHDNELVNVYSPCLHSSVRHTFEILKKLNGLDGSDIMTETELKIREEQIQFMEEDIDENAQETGA